MPESSLSRPFICKSATAANVGFGLKIAVYTARWCPKCRDIAQLIEKSGVECKSIVLDDTPEGVEELKEHTQFTDVPALEIDGKMVFGYFPRQLSILLNTTLGARDHRGHSLARARHGVESSPERPE